MLSVEKVAIFQKTDDGRNVWIEGHVVIEGTEHYVRDGYVSCNPSLNHKAWDETEKVDRCRECFKENMQNTQLELFSQQYYK